MSMEEQKQGPDPVPCSFENCPLVFDTEMAMIIHKQKSPDHNYCFKCKLDFDNKQDLFMHNITSPKHHTCPICGLDFRSDSGRDVHIRNLHRIQQSITCPSCRAHFASAAAFMRHIEVNECSDISVSTMTLEQNRSEIQRNWVYNRPFPGLSRLPPASQAHGSRNNDIALAPSCADPNLTNALVLYQPGAADARSSNTTSSDTEHLPSLPAEPDDLLIFDEDEDLPTSGPEVSSSAMGKEPQREMHLDMTPTSVREMLRQRYPDWDANAYYNSKRGVFICPCHYESSKKPEFEYHIAMEQRWAKSTQCPQCGKIFRSTASLVAHMETSQTRCSIREQSEYAQALSDFTGGLARVEGELEDGRERIVARKPAEIEAAGGTTPAAAEALSLELEEMKLI